MAVDIEKLGANISGCFLAVTILTTTVVGGL